MIRSAKMNATTPPKLIPPFHSTAASGTLPIEQTKLSIDDDRPDERPPELGSQRVVGEEQVLPERLSGTQAPTAPAISSPMTMSRRTAAHSITKMWLTDGEALAAEPSRCQNDPSPATLMSIAA